MDKTKVDEARKNLACRIAEYDAELSVKVANGGKITRSDKWAWASLCAALQDQRLSCDDATNIKAELSE